MLWTRGPWTARAAFLNKSRSSTEYQNWIYRVSADILRVSQSCWRNMRYFFRSPTIIAGYIYKFASEVIAADQRKTVQPAVVMYFIRILFGISNCLGKGEAIFFLCAWRHFSRSPEIRDLTAVSTFIFAATRKITFVRMSCSFWNEPRSELLNFISHISLARVHWWEPVLFKYKP